MASTVGAVVRMLKRFQGAVQPNERFGRLLGGRSERSGSFSQEVAQDRVHLLGLDEEAVMPVQGADRLAPRAGDAFCQLLGLGGQEEPVGVHVHHERARLHPRQCGLDAAAPVPTSCTIIEWVTMR